MNTGTPRIYATDNDRKRAYRKRQAIKKWEQKQVNIKTLLNNELDRIKPEVEEKVDQAIQDLTTRIVNKTPDGVRSFLLGKLGTIHGNPIVSGVLTLVVETFDFAPYVAKGVIQSDKLRAEIKKRIEGARF